jgi:Holliday junction DNA helicase RuvA
MLSYISGIIKTAEEQKIVMDIGSLGFTLQVPNERLFTLNAAATVHTYLHWNQEQGPTLFGFQTELERTIFLLVISCSGLGPKIGLAVLAHMGPQAFLQAIQTGNESALSKVSGIGPKKAEQMIMQLKHKVSKLAQSGIVLETSESFEQWHNISEVLTSLNYSRTEVTQAMKHLGDAYAGQALSFDQLMRHALSFLSKRA